jgi:hypothetical protein
MTRIAAFISFVFHPLFTPIYALGTLLFIESKPIGYLVNDSLYYMDTQYKHVLLLLYLIFTVATPLLSMVFLKLNGSISSYYIEKQQERFQPMLLTACYFLFLFGFLFYEIPNSMLPMIVVYIPLGGALILCLGALINRWIKISMHLLGMGAWCAIVYSYYSHQMDVKITLFVFLFLLAGIVASARLFLGAHQQKEVYLAFGLAFFVQFFTLFFFVY